MVVYGGKSRRDHSEIGSGFIHFNFTPWGQHGDKATPSLIGNVVRGVFLREPRIFLGGVSGLVGPQKIGFGSMTGAGQVIRKEVLEARLVCQRGQEIDQEIAIESIDPGQMKLKINLEYIGQLVALKAWYQGVRLARIPVSPELTHLCIVIEEAINTIQVCIDERLDKLNRFLLERGIEMPALDLTSSLCPKELLDESPYTTHTDWVYGLSDDHVELGISWLRKTAENVAFSYFRKVG